MADIVSSLFGLTPREAEQQATQQNYELGALIGAASINPYDTAINQDAEIKRQAALAALGGQAVRGVAGLFGVQDERLKRATTIESILQSTQQELGDFVNNPAVLYPALQKKLADAGFSREAMQVGQVGQKAIQEAGLNQATMQKNRAEALAKQQEVLREEQLRTALASLPENATEAQYLEVVRKFAPAKDVMASIEKSQTAEENRKAKLEEIRLRAEENRKNTELILNNANISREDKQAFQQQQAKEAQAFKLQIAEIVQSNKGLNLTPAQKRADVVFGEEYSNYVALGGKSVIDKQIAEINAVIDMIEKEKANVSGKDVATAAAIGDTALAAYSPKALEARDKIGGVVQSNLRAILGGQFAQKEGEALLSRAYNLAADPKDNVKRLKALKEQIINSTKAKESAINYYEDKGTLSGYKPNQKEDPLGIRK